MPSRLLFGLNVLIVEDDDLNAQALFALLDLHGATIQASVFSVTAAIAMLPLKHPCVAIVNFNLQTATCEPLLERLKQQNVPFVIVTGAVPALLPSAIAAERVVIKPYAFDVLLAEIAAAVQAAADISISNVKGRLSCAD